MIEYNNHFFKFGIREFLKKENCDVFKNEEFYVCIKCNTHVIFNKVTKKFYQLTNDRDYTFYSDDLTCDEIIIKNIIE